MKTTNHDLEVPTTKDALAASNGHSPNGLESSRGVELNAQLVRENARLAQENAQLVQERDLLRTLIDGLPDNIFVKDRQSRFLVSNLAHVQALGAKSQADVLGKTDRDVFPAEFADQYLGDETALMESGQLLNRQETAVNPKTGEKRWLQTTKVPLRDKKGEVIGLVGISRDITPQKQTEEELSKERRLLRTLIDNLPDGVYIKDTEGRKTMVNQADLKILGCKTEAEAVGKNDFDLFPKELAEKFWADDQKVIQGEPLINREECVEGGAGEKRWLLTSKLPLRDQDGKITGLVGIGRDITEQKRTEEALRKSRDELEKRVAERAAELVQERMVLRTLLDHLPVAVYLKDLAGRKTLANRVELEYSGVKTETDILGKTDSDLYPQASAAGYNAIDQEIIRTGQPLLNHESTFTKPDGSIIYLLGSVVPLRDATGRITGLAGMNLDITDRKRAEEALTQERALLRSLTENLPGYVYAKNAEGRFVMANTGVARQLGFSAPNEVIGKTDFDLFPQDLATRYRAEELEMMKSGQGLNNHEGPTVDASYKEKNRWVSTTKVILRDVDGKVTGFIGLGQDITERKHAEEALVRERSLLRTLIDSLPDAIYAKDAAGRKTMVNPADLKNLKCQTEADAVGKTDFDFFPKEIAEKFQADDMKVFQGQAVIDREEYFFNEAGEKRWLLSSKLPLRDPNGYITGLVGIGRDITARKQAEDALRTSERKLRQFTVQLERSNRELQDFAYVASHDLQEPLRKIVVFGERIKEKSSAAMGPDAIDYLDRMQKAAARMQTLINDLLTFSRITTKAQPFSPVNLAEVASGVVEDLEGRIELVKGRVELGALPVIDAEPLQMRQLLQNLIGNALKFRRPEEPPVVKVNAELIADPAAPEKQLCRLTVNDNCIGFEEKYLDRIFNVFQRLHTRNEYEGTGMGLAIVRKIALYHGGDITAKSKPGEGSTFILTIPVVHQREAQTENNTNQESKQP